MCTETRNTKYTRITVGVRVIHSESVVALMPRQRRWLLHFQTNILLSVLFFISG